MLGVVGSTETKSPLQGTLLSFPEDCSSPIDDGTGAAL